MWLQSRPAPAYENLSIQDALARVDAGARLVDVRETYEFVEGHIPGAELHPLSEWPAVTLDWNPADPIVVLCRSGGRSARAASVLADRGFTSVVNVLGGMMAYEGTRRPIERG